MTKVFDFLDSLKEKATKLNNTDALKKMETKEFTQAATLVSNVLDELNVSLSEDVMDSYSFEKIITEKIARTLSKSFFTIYYIDLKTEKYLGYSSIENYKALNIEESGEKFFSEVSKNIDKVIYHEDRDYVRSRINKNNLIEKTKDGRTYRMTYRIMLNNVPTYVSLTAMKVTGEDTNIIIGLSNISEEKKREIELKHEIEENATYTNIALSLITDFLDIYYVNLKDDSYIQYKIDKDNQTLNPDGFGNKFFATLNVTSRRLIHPDDIKKFTSGLAKDNLIKELEKSGSFKLTYRQLFDGKPKYISLIALYQTHDKKHIILATTDTDEKIKQENAFKKKLANEKKIARTDVLTGALNKYSYTEIESILNSKIQKKEVNDLALIIADLNDLKVINDTKGHEAGDKLIKDAKNILSTVFKESPIYRIGGDEFVVILEGKDFYNRNNLIDKVHKISLENIHTEKAILAIGLANYDPVVDRELLSLFNRADQAMYDNKKYLKSL